MFKANKKIEIASYFLIIFLIICQIFLSYTTFADNEDASRENGGEYSLNFGLTRSDYADYKAQDSSQQKDCFVEYELHNEEQPGTIVEKMSYTADTDSWVGDVYFQNIRIPYDNVEVEYYNANDGNSIEPNLLHYALYLKKSGDKMVLSIPKILSNENPSGNTNDSGLLNVKDIRVEDVNSSEYASLRMSANPAKQQNAGTEIFLNGKNGDDEKDGTSPENAVKTFAKAKKLAEGNSKITRIMVTGTTDVEGNISLKGTKASIFRDKDFNEYLLNVPSNKSATFKDITIDGNSDENTNIEKSLVYVNENATLNIEDGAVLRNNKIKAIENTATQGGAICSYSATINMTGGIVDKNQATYGGGIYLYKSTMNFSGGSVQNNRSELVFDKNYKQYYSAGGGILAYDGSTINMSDKAKVISNFANEIGGGISLGSNQVGGSNYLNMKGGIITQNVAGASGGGLFIQAKYFNGGKSFANISAGQITFNKMDGSGVTNKAFGGGGIYVNGASKEFQIKDENGNWQKHFVNGENGELYLKNAVIYDNTSKQEGAGMACCPISKTKIYVNDGVAFYENDSNEKSGNDLFFYSNNNYLTHSGEADYELSKLMLGGAPYNWTMDNGNPLPDEKYKGILKIGEGEDNSLPLNVK